MTVRGSHADGSVLLRPMPGAQFYYVAVTGLTANGERVQLAWPDVESWQWRGTLLQYVQSFGR